MPFQSYEIDPAVVQAWTYCSSCADHGKLLDLTVRLVGSADANMYASRGRGRGRPAPGRCTARGYQAVLRMLGTIRARG